MLETSQDILNLAKTGGVILLSLMFAWLLYYMIQITRGIFKITKEMRERMNKIDEIIDKIRSKIDHATSYIVLISEGVKKLVDFYHKKSEKKDKGNSRKK